MFEQLDLFANQFDTAEEAVSHINEYEAPSEAAINYIYKNFKELKMTFNMLVSLELRQVGIDYNKLEPEDLIKADYKLIKEAGVDYSPRRASKVYCISISSTSNYLRLLQIFRREKIIQDS